MKTLKFQIDDRLSERLKQRAHDAGMSTSEMVNSLLSIALDEVDVQDEVPPPRKLDETTQRCIDSMRDVCGRLKEASPTVGLIKFSDASEAPDGAVVRTLSLCVMMLPPRT